MSASTFQDRIAEIIQALGGQNPAVQAVKLRYGKAPSQQALGHLVKRTGPKLAAGSKWTPYLAACAGYSAEWAASGKGEKMATVPARVELGEAPARKSKTEAKLNLDREINELVNDWLSLNGADRMAFKEALSKAAMMVRPTVRNERLSKEWANPDLEKPAPAKARNIGNN